MLAEFHHYCDDETEIVYWLRKRHDWLVIAELGILRLHISMQNLRYHLTEGGLV